VNVGIYIQIILGILVVVFLIFLIAVMTGSRKKSRVLKQIDILTDELGRQRRENIHLRDELKSIASVDNQFFASMIRLTSRFNPDDISKEIVTLLETCLDAQQVGIFLADPRGKRLTLISHYGLNENWLPKLIYELTDEDHQGKVGVCYAKTHRITNREFVVMGLREPYPVFDPDLCVPIFFQEKKFGVIALTRNDELTERELNLLGVVSSIAGVAFNNTKSFADITYTAQTDRLTKLYNKGFFEEQLEKELMRAKRFQHNLSVAIIDLDNFKEYNDTYGHQAGDHLLMQLSQIFSSHFDATDTLARYGGDEFIVMCPEIKKQDAARILNNLLHDLETHDFARGPKKVQVTFSAGVASYPDDGSNHTELQKLADHALYEAKREGRNTVMVYKPKIEQI
jgi:diguanylate cyclase (GGDEF)-like protein